MGNGELKQDSPVLWSLQEGMVPHYKPRNVSLDIQVQEMVQNVGLARPTYGTLVVQKIIVR